MPPIKDYFDPKKREKLLEGALKKSKDGEKRPVAFGVGKSGSFLALDFRNEYSPEKLLKEIKKTEFKDRFIVGLASINGKIIEFRTLHKKGSVKPKDVKEFMASGIKSTVSRAIIDGKGDDEDEGAAQASPDQEQEQGTGTEQGDAQTQDMQTEISNDVLERLKKVPAIWQQTRRTIANNIEQLKAAIKKAFASDGREAIAEIEKNMKAIDRVLVKLDDRLVESLEKAGAAQDRRAFVAELKGTTGILTEYVKYVASDPLIDHLDSNPFGVKTDLKKTISASLQQVHKTIGQASKAA